MSKKSVRIYFKAVLVILIIAFTALIGLKSQRFEFENPAGFNMPFFSPSDSANSIIALNRDIIKIINDNNIKTPNYGIVIYSIDSKKYFFIRNPELNLTPASTTKIFTALSSLFLMGENYSVSTTVYCEGNITNGILNGNLYIVGKGDPLFKLNDLDSLVKQLTKSGIKEIKGDIYADGSFYDGIRERLAYSGDKELVQAVQPVSALNIENNIATVKVMGNTQSGRFASASVSPPSEAFKISVGAKVYGTSGRRKTNKSKLDEGKNLFESYGGPLRSPFQFVRNGQSVSVTTKMIENGIQLFNVNGSIELGDTYSYSHYIQNPNLAVAGVLKARLISAGVKIEGNIGEKQLPSDYNKFQIKQIAEFSRPLMEILVPMVKNSDNYLAESIFKMVGAKSGKYKDNAKEARRVIAAMLDSLNLPCKDATFYDGSGLSRRNKVTPDCLVKLLSSFSMISSFKYLDSTLAIAGIDGTLRNRMTGSLAENNLRGKTGTHSNVSALAGYVTTLDGERLAFAFMFNGYELGAYKNIENDIGALLAQFFYFNKEN